MQCVLNALGIWRLLGFRSGYLPCWFAPNLAVLAVDGVPGPEQFVRAGMALQRLWLRTTALGHALQPFAAPALFATPAMGWVSPNLKGWLQKEWGSLLDGSTPLMVARIGIARPAGIRAGRPNTSNFYAARGAPPEGGVDP